MDGLKDASSTALYGSVAMAVIIIHNQEGLSGERKWPKKNYKQEVWKGALRTSIDEAAQTVNTQRTMLFAVLRQTRRNPRISRRRHVRLGNSKNGTTVEGLARLKLTVRIKSTAWSWRIRWSDKNLRWFQQVIVKRGNKTWNWFKRYTKKGEIQSI